MADPLISLHEEIWKPVVGREDFYEVSNMGRVRSGKYGRYKLKKTRMDANGYLVVTLSVPKKGSVPHLVHILVVKAFYGPYPSSGHEANHKNKVRHDARLENLEYVTHQENMRHAWKGEHKRGAHKQYGCKNRWMASIGKDGKQIYLGSFATEDEAHEAYVLASDSKRYL